MFNFIRSLFGSLAFIPGLALIVMGCILPQLWYDVGDSFPWIRYIIGSLMVIIGAWPIAWKFHIPNARILSLGCLMGAIIAVFPWTGGTPIEITTKALVAIFLAIIGMGITND